MASRGDIYWADMPDVQGSEQAGRRPVLVVQNDVNNRASTTTIVATITGQPRRQRLPFHVPISAGDSGLPRDSTVLCEQIRTVSQTRLGAHAGSLSTTKMREIDRALVWSLGLRDLVESS